MTSKIKVDNIENQCGGAVVTKCGGTTTISGTVVKSNTLQASDAGNIISQSGTTITLGASGDTINLASGASQSGFGRTGTVDWDTTAKTGDFTAVNGTGYFCNTSGGVFTFTLPASPSAGDIVALKDYALTFDTNALAIDRNGSLINGTAGTSLNIGTEGATVMFVYVDGTKGWIPTQDDASALVPSTPTFIVATGGTITTVCTNYKAHTFTGPGTFTVCSVGNACGSTTVDYLVVGGGGSGPSSGGGDGITGGGGGGGFRFYANPATNPQSGPGSPLNGPAAITVSATGYPIVVGGGGARDLPVGASGVASSGLGITSTGGGRGGRGDPSTAGQTGGSGGGGSNTGSAGAGNTPPVSPSQGNPGGAGSNPYATGGGGGGAIVAAVPVTGPRQGIGGAGGGLTGFGTSGQSSGGQYYFSGGGGGAYNGPTPAPGAAGGIGGGGSGGYSNACGNAGTANTGGGGGGASDYPGGNGGGNGGSGIVVIRYKFQ